MKRFVPSRLTLFVGGALFLAVAGRVDAHHSFAATYQADDRIEIEGTVKELVWRNPHSFLRIDVAEDDGTVRTWSWKWTSANRASAPTDQTTLVPAGWFIATGSPARNPDRPACCCRRTEAPSPTWELVGDID